MIFSVTSMGSVGCTFLDWSIHYLAGRDEFFSTESGWAKLSPDPIQLSTANAHGHPKNHPDGFEETLLTIEKLEQQNSDLCSFYPKPLGTRDAAGILGISSEQFGSMMPEINRYQGQDFNKIWNLCVEKKIPIIILDCQDSIYHWCYRGKKRTLITNKIFNSTNDILREMMNVFFPNEIRQWMEDGSLESNWDLREFSALNIRPYDQINTVFNEAYNLDQPHLWIAAEDFWFNDNIIQRVMDYLKLPINSSRLSNWWPIYFKWRKMQAQVMQFSWGLNHICDSIIKNYDFDLRPYKLTPIQEAIIQHIIIYKYNLNFKTWQLEKFPDNTKDLHQLLEPNRHSIKDIYGTL